MLPFIDFVPVTKDHLERGKPMVCDACGVALALKDKFKIDEVRIGSTDEFSFVTLHTHQVKIYVCESVKAFIRAYDKGIKLMPTVLIIEFYAYGEARLLHLGDYLNGHAILNFTQEQMNKFKALLKQVENGQATVS